MVLRIIVSLFIVVIGAVITIKAEWFYQNFGAIPSADKYLGTEGGSRLAYKIIGIIICIIGFLVMTNMAGSVIMWIFGSLFSGFAN